MVTEEKKNWILVTGYVDTAVISHDHYCPVKDHSNLGFMLILYGFCANVRWYTI